MVGRLVSAVFFFCIVTPVAAVSINFDTDGTGNPMTVPPVFLETTPLRNLYSSLGVTFSGPGPLDGGAILDQNGGFGVPARSGRNFLAFNTNPSVFMLNGGRPIDPQTMTFSTPIISVSIYGSGGFEPASFRMDAFDAQSGLVSTTTGNSLAGSYVLLSLSSATPITRVVLTQIGSDDAWVYDDLNFTFVPEPAAALGVLPLGLVLARRTRRREPRGN